MHPSRFKCRSAHSFCFAPFLHQAQTTASHSPALWLYLRPTSEFLYLGFNKASSACGKALNASTIHDMIVLVHILLLTLLMLSVCGLSDRRKEPFLIQLPQFKDVGLIVHLLFMDSPKYYHTWWSKCILPSGHQTSELINTFHIIYVDYFIILFLPNQCHFYIILVILLLRWPIVLSNTSHCNVDPVLTYIWQLILNWLNWIESFTSHCVTWFF